MIDPAIFDGDPPVREDGSCAVCLGPRHPERAARYAREIAAMDAFCSSPCARKWHNNPLPAGAVWSKPGNAFPYRRLRTFVAPWAEIAYLRRELHGAKTSCSSEAKRGNRLAERIKVLDGKLSKRLAQSRHDQAYIDALESRLESASIQAARQEIKS